MDFGLSLSSKQSIMLSLAAAYSLSFQKLSKEIKNNIITWTQIYALYNKTSGYSVGKRLILDVLMWGNLAFILSEPELRDENMNVDDILAGVPLICQIAH